MKSGITGEIKPQYFAKTAVSGQKHFAKSAVLGLKHFAKTANRYILRQNSISYDNGVQTETIRQNASVEK